MKKFLILSCIVLAALASCKKPGDIITGGFNLAFSTDTVLFDTVFTTIGSSTRQLRIKNPTNSTINITRIELAGGAQSSFRLNIDGIPTRSFDNYELEPKDSLYIFVDVTVDPNNTNNPMILTDSIRFMLDDRMQDVDLVAWGQDAYFYGPSSPGSIFYALPCDITLTNDKPHVFYGYAVIDSACQLDIDPGTRVHFHANSGLIAFKDGTLKINGEFDNEVVIEGDRLEPFYENAPGQWGNYSFGGIYCSPGSINNEINYAIIRNGIVGVHADTVGNSSNPTLTINNTIIENMAVMGLIGRGTNLIANNMLIKDCGQYAAILSYGGEYEFRHCTFANYWNFSARQDPSVILNNYYESSLGDIISRDLAKAYFSNCIIYGSADGELAFDESEDALFDPFFENCMIKVDSEFDKNQPSRFNTLTTFNIYPRFKDILEGDFSLDTLSPAQNAGDSKWINDPILQLDLANLFRFNDAAPDIGAYERYE